MQIKRLIELLSQEDQEAVVVVEGCDCADDAVGISKGYGAYEGNVVIRRAEGCFSSEKDEEVKS